MAWKVDNSQASLSIVTYGVSTVDGVAAAGDLQAFSLVTVASPGTAATSVGPANPLPVKQTHGKTVLYGVVNTAVSGDNTLVSASGATQIKLIGIVLVVAAAVTVQLKSATVAETGQRNLSGPMPLSANGGWQDRAVLADQYLVVTDASKSLVLTLGAGVQASGYFSYVQE